jgi:parvulin-like peptidyl-prolyl isomerase
VSKKLSRQNTRFSLLTILGLVIAITLFMACGKKAEGPKVIAIVGSYEITDEQVSKEVAKLPGTPEDYHAAAVAALNRLVDEALLLSEAQKRNLTVTDEEVEKRLGALVDDYPPGAFEDYLANHGLTEKDVRDQIKKSMLAAAALEALISEKGDVSNEEIGNYYKDNTSEFAKGDSVVLRKVTVASADEVELVKQKLSFGEDFAAVARANSLDAAAADGGELGEVELTRLPESDRAAIASLTPGGVSDPVSHANGQYVFYLLEEKRSARTLTLEEATPFIRNKLALQKSQLEYPDIIDQLKTAYKVQIDEQNIPQNPQTHED